MKRFTWLISILILILLFSTVGSAFADSIYVVQPGDTLYQIAIRFGVTTTAIVEANNLINPNLIYAGQELVIPGSSGGGSGSGSGSQGTTQSPPAAPPTGDTIYIVQPGDWLSKIALQFGVTTTSIVVANGLANPNFVYVGQQLIIPGGSGTATPPAPPAPTPPPAPAPSANLLPNPSFENGYTNLYGAPELQVPVGWSMEIDEGTLAPGTGLAYLRPESRIAPVWGFPPQEQGLFVWNGNWTLKVFKGGAPVSFRLFTDLYLQPGTYQFTANYFPDIVSQYRSDGSKVWASQALAGEVYFLNSGGGSGWRAMAVGVKNTMVETFTVSAPGTVRLGVGWRARYTQANNGLFIDDWSLQKLN